MAKIYADGLPGSTVERDCSLHGVPLVGGTCPTCAALGSMANRRWHACLDGDGYLCLALTDTPDLATMESMLGDDQRADLSLYEAAAEHLNFHKMHGGA